MPKLTKTIIDTAKASDTELWLWDSTLPGFGVRVRTSGRKTYIARYRTHDGTQRKLNIGRCTDLTPDQARELARKAFAAAAAGEDPAKARQDARAAPTMAELQERYMRLHAPYKKPSSVRMDQRNWAKHIIPAMGSKKVDSVTQADVQALHGKLAANPATANHVRALLSKAFNLAASWGMRTKPNPCVGVKRFRVRQRERVLTPEELRRLDAALTPGPLANLVRLLILTGCRLSEIMTARREWVDHQRRLLLLPDSKVGQRRIDLPEAALAIIRAMPEGQEWLIPGKRRGTHMEKPYAAWYKVTKAAGLRGLRFHDLRHSAGSIGHMLGLTQRQIADMLGHSSMATTERYLHGYKDEAVRAVDVLAERITQVWSDPGPASRA